MDKIICPICGEHDFTEEFELCPVCEWQYDKLQYKDHQYWGGANDLSVDDYKAEWLAKKQTAIA